MINLYTEDWNFENIDTILMDKDGTIVDSNPYWGRIVELRVLAISKFYGVSEKYYSDFCMVLGYDMQSKKLLENAPIALLSRNEIINLMIKELQKIGIESTFLKISEIFDEVHKEFLPQMYDYIFAINGVEDFLAKMKNNGVKIAVVTSDINLNAKKTMEHLGFMKYFDLIIGKDNCTQDKKTGEPALVALEKLNSKNQNTISIGDAPMDYEMAKNADLKGSILVATGQMSLELLKQLTNTSVVSLSSVKIK